MISIIVIPVCCSNFKANQVSTIDNSMLPQMPMAEDYATFEDYTDALENYLKMRVGFRDSMVNFNLLYTDKLFGLLNYPGYMYGEDENIFQNYSVGKETTDFYNTFADFVVKAKNYCAEKGLEFLFVLNPTKNAVYQDKLPSGVNYNRTWLNNIYSKFLGVNILDNTDYLKSIKESGIKVFNEKYDINHWNDYGAFYGVNNILKSINIPQNSLDEFLIGSWKATSMLGTVKFPIDETVKTLTNKFEAKNMTNKYVNEILIDSQYKAFKYFVNENKLADLPRVLIFQGSYMNGYGYKFLENGLYEYIAVHDYQNVINMDYYINIFEPDIVIFETAE